MTRLFAFGMIALFETTFLPASASAQPPVPIVDAGSQPPAEGQVSTARDPHRYLAAARQQLQAVPTQNLSKDARNKLDQLREDFELLATSYERRSLSASNPQASGTTNSSSSAEAVNWKLQFDAVERDLVAILGAGPELGADATPAVAGTSGVVPTPATVAAADVGAAAQVSAGSQAAQPVGSSGAQAGVTATTNVDTQTAGLAGVAVTTIGVKKLDPAIRDQLEEMRNSVEMFYDATTSLRHR